MLRVNWLRLRSKNSSSVSKAKGQNFSLFMPLAGIILAFLVIGCATPMSAISGGNTIAQGETPSRPPAKKPAIRDLGQMLPISATARMGDETIELEVTRTPKQQALGLMYRTNLPDNRGMLFEFSPARPISFWMKNMRISLDMVFLRGGVIRAIAANVPPCSAEPCPTYGPNVPIDQVIELRRGRAAELGLKVGQRVEIRFLSQPSSNIPSQSQ